MLTRMKKFISVVDTTLKITFSILVVGTILAVGLFATNGFGLWDKEEEDPWRLTQEEAVDTCLFRPSISLDGEVTKTDVGFDVPVTSNGSDAVCHVREQRKVLRTESTHPVTFSDGEDKSMTWGHLSNGQVQFFPASTRQRDEGEPLAPYSAGWEYSQQDLNGTARTTLPRQSAPERKLMTFVQIRAVTVPVLVTTVLQPQFTVISSTGSVSVSSETNETK